MNICGDGNCKDPDCPGTGRRPVTADRSKNSEVNPVEPIYVEYIDGSKVLIGYRKAGETVEQWADRQGQKLDEQFDEFKAWCKFKGLEVFGEHYE